MPNKIIAEVELVNYRSHEYTVIKFGMLTSIVGANDQGKSNVWRGMEMVLCHESFPDTALRHGTNEGSVKVTFTDGTWLKRWRKGQTQNLITFDGKEEVTNKTIKGLEAIVADISGFAPILVDRGTGTKATPTYESIQVIASDAGQNFLLRGMGTDTILRRVNRLMLGSGIETAKRSLESELRSLNQAQTGYDRDIDRAEQLIEALTAEVWTTSASDVERIEADLKEFDVIGELIETVKQAQKDLAARDKVAAARKAINGWESNASKTRDKLGKHEDLDKLVTIVKSAKTTIIGALDKLDPLYGRDDEIKEELEKLRPEIERLEAEERETIRSTAVAQAQKTISQAPVKASAVSIERTTVQAAIEAGDAVIKDASGANIGKFKLAIKELKKCVS